MDNNNTNYVHVVNWLFLLFQSHPMCTTHCVVSRTSSNFLFVLYYLASVSPNSANGPKVLTPSLAEFVFRLTKLTKLLENVHWNALLPIEIKRNHQIWPIPPKNVLFKFKESQRFMVVDVESKNMIIVKWSIIRTFPLTS